MSRAAPDAPLTDRLAREIAASGPVPFSAFMTEALYDPEHGFFGTSGAGRQGAAFLTSVEVGPLFGRLVGRALDAHWHDLGDPDPFVVVEAGAGRGQLAHTVLRSAPECSSVLRYVTVEQSATLRAEQEERFADAAVGPEIRDGFSAEEAGTHVLFANELLDNLPFEVAWRRREGWVAVYVDWRDGFVETAGELPTPWPARLDALGLDDAPVDTRLPVPVGLGPWLDAAAGTLVPGGRLVAVDYAATTAVLLQREGGWLRTYRAQGRGADPLHQPGSQDITADVWIEAFDDAVATADLVPIAAPVTQVRWLQSLGVDELVRAGARAAADRSLSNLEALEARSRAGEARALTDAAGLGGHVVFTVEKPRAGAQ